MANGAPNEPQRPHPIRSVARAREFERRALEGVDRLGRKLAAPHPLAHLAASGRVAAWTGFEPQVNDRGPAQVAWRRERGIDGYLNRSHRRAIARGETR